MSKVDWNANACRHQLVDTWVNKFSHDIMQIEEEYDIELDEDDLLDQKTVYGFAAFVAARVAKE